MTLYTKSNPVTNIINKFRISRHTFYMMCLETRTFMFTFPASIRISLKNLFSPLNIFSVGSTEFVLRSNSALPFMMILSFMNRRIMFFRRFGRSKASQMSVSYSPINCSTMSGAKLCSLFTFVNKKLLATPITYFGDFFIWVWSSYRVSVMSRNISSWSVFFIEGSYP